MNHYPSWRYHATQEPKIVNDAHEDAALGEGWEHSPAAFEKAEKAEKGPAVTTKPLDPPAGTTTESLTVAQLTELLIAKGKDAKELKGKKKPELIEMLKAE